MHKSLFSTAIIPYAAYQVVTSQKYWLATAIQQGLQSVSSMLQSFNQYQYVIVLIRVATCDTLHVTSCYSQLPCMPILHSGPSFMLRAISESLYMVTCYVHNICYGIMDLFLRKFTFNENQTFYGGHTVTQNYYLSFCPLCCQDVSSFVSSLSRCVIFCQVDT